MAVTTAPLGRRAAGALVPAVVVAAVAGLMLRAWVLTSRLGVIDSDEAVGALIAYRLLHDLEWQTFLWGNFHGGTVEAIPTAVVFAVTGASPLAAKIVPIALAAAAAVVVGRLTRRLVGGASGATAGVLAGAALWLLPGHFLVLSTKARLYYGASLLLVAAILLLVARLDDRRRGGATGGRAERDDLARRHGEIGGRAERDDLLLLGLFVGIGLWTAVFVFYAAVPAGLWYAVRNRARWRRWWLVLPGVVIGGAPWWAFQLRYDFPSLEEDAPFQSTYVERLGRFVTELAPRTLGVRAPGSGDWVLGGAGLVLYPLIVAALVAVVLRWPRRLSLPAAVVVGYPFVWAVPSSSFYVAEPRYGIFLAPALAVLVGAGLAPGVRRSTAPLAVAAVAVMVVASAWGVGGLDRWAGVRTGNWDVAAPEIDPLIELLDDRGVERAYADYWIAYRLAFETDEDVIATPLGFVRYPPYARAVDEADPQTWIVYAGAPKDANLGPGLDDLGVEWDRVEVGPYAVYSTDREVRPAELPSVQFVP